MNVVSRRMRALVLDEEYLIATSIEACLNECGFETVIVLSQAAALAALATDFFDIAIVDDYLSSGSCDAVLARLDEVGTPYALCTGLTESEVRARRPGQVVIAKPFLDVEVTAAIRKVIGVTAALS